MDIEFIRYCRSKSSAFGNAARKRDPEKAWKETIAFLDGYTNYGLSIQPTIELWNTSQPSMERLLSQVKAEYGETDFESGTPYRWLLPKKFDPKLLQLVFMNKDHPTQGVGPIRIHLPFWFEWKSIPIPVLEKYSDVFEYFNRGKHGSFSIIIDSRLFIQSEFVIPYGLGTIEASEFINDLRSKLPFKLSDSSLVCFRSKLLKNGKVTYKSYGTYKKFNVTNAPKATLGGSL
ncbi:hypothetical protein BTA51_23465 [Hahella sp. CCB-MM4]|uniref:hypothetical protein n=1 Tax=Hahella sp. (strain CCB-MM4) TaxID=1926491 RepID=UPI000B9BBF69|nr:hypothetical protein [Hahella sp. CCB-MM4]OZG71063.1 hypothetical protein BTA51_23465 [Hahella sp. CCB-MM4]